jgi:tetratricopeptide (TPR) repeat protein
MISIVHYSQNAAPNFGGPLQVESIAGYLEQQGLTAVAPQVRAMASTAVAVGSAATADSLLVLAEERIRLGDGLGAMDALRQAEEKGLQGADQLSRSGYVWLKVRRYADAEKRLDQAAADPASAVHYRALAGRGAARYHLGRREEGLKDIAAAKSISPSDPLAYLLLGLAYKDVGDLPAARRELQAGLKVAPNDPRLVHALDGLK